MNVTGNNPDLSNAFSGAMIGLVILYLAAFVFAIYTYTRVAAKAGWPAWYGVLVIVPIVNIVIGLMFVFSEWPVEREVKALRAQLARNGPVYNQRTIDPRFSPGYGTATGMYGPPQQPENPYPFG